MSFLATDEPRVNRLVIIGLGLIGSSLALAAKSIGLVNTVIGISRRSSTLELALDLSIVDETYQDLASVASQLTSGDVVVIGVPTLSVPVVMADCHRLLSKDVTITDVASVKGSVVDALREI